MVNKKEWNELTADEKDLFVSPHTKMASSAFTTSGFGLKDAALRIIDGLSDDGKKTALSELEKVIPQLTPEFDVDRAARKPSVNPVPHRDIEAVRARLRTDLGLN